jgi:hypothetical protein
MASWVQSVSKDLQINYKLKFGLTWTSVKCFDIKINIQIPTNQDQIQPKQHPIKPNRTQTISQTTKQPINSHLCHS